MKRNLKKIMLTTAALLSITCHVMGMDAVPIQESDHRHSKPLYADYLSRTTREKIDSLLDEVMSVLSNEFLIKNGLQPLDILNASKKPNFRVDDFIPGTLEHNIYEAVRTVAVHYAYLHSVRTIMASTLKEDTNLNWEEDLKSLLADCNFNLEEVVKLGKSNCKVFRANQVKQLVEYRNNQDQEPQAPQKRVLFFASVSGPFQRDYSTRDLSILFMNEPTDDPLKEPLNDLSLTLPQIINAYQFMKSFENIPSNDHMTDFIETLSAGAELKDALDCLMGTKHVNLQQGPMYFGAGNHQHEYLKHELLSKSQEVKAFQTELGDSELTDQNIKSKLEVKMRIARAKEAALAKSLEIITTQSEKDAETGFAKQMFPEQLIENAKKRQKILLMLKKATDLFSDAFIENQDSRTVFIKKHFDLTK